jgi:hypothetical protein
MWMTTEAFSSSLVEVADATLRRHATPYPIMHWGGRLGCLVATPLPAKQRAVYDVEDGGAYKARYNSKSKSIGWN